MAEQARRVETVAADPDHRVGTRQTGQQVAGCRIELLVHDHHIAGLDHGAEHLAHPAAVVGGELQATLGQQIGTEEVLYDRGSGHRRDHGADAELAGELTLPDRRSTQRCGFGADRQMSHDRRPAPLTGQPFEGGQDVLADRAGDASVGQPGLDAFDHPTEIADGAGQHFPVRIDAVVDRDRIRQVQLETESGQAHGRGVDTGDQDDRGPRRSVLRRGSLFHVFLLTIMTIVSI